MTLFAGCVAYAPACGIWFAFRWREKYYARFAIWLGAYERSNVGISIGKESRYLALRNILHRT